MLFVEAVLMALNEGKSGDSLGTVSMPLRSLMPRSLRKSVPSDEEVKLKFWYDFSSPWAFLGWTQLDALKRQFGPSLQIEMKPFLLGVLFREWVSSGLYNFSHNNAVTGLGLLIFPRQQCQRRREGIRNGFNLTG
jgi:hypothetical protein